MSVLLVNASHLPCLEFFQLGICLTVRVSIDDGDGYFDTFYSFPSENLYGYVYVEKLLEAFAKKYGYDNFEYVL